MVGLFPNAFEVVCELLRQSLQDLWCRIHPSPQLQEDDALIVFEYPPVAFLDSNRYLFTFPSIIRFHFNWYVVLTPRIETF